MYKLGVFEMQELTFTQFLQNHMFLTSLFVGLSVLLIYTEIQIRNRRYNEVKPSEAINLINHQNAVVIDVRSDKEFEQGHIINALNIPLDKLEQSSKKLSKYKDKAIIIYCRTGQTSQRACKQLEKDNFSKIHNLRGGLLSWERDSLPLSSGK